MIADVDPSAIVLATLAVSLVLFVTDAVRYEIVALLIVLALTLTGCLTPREAFRGFASPAVILIASMYVFGHAVTRWGVAEVLGQRVLARGTRSETLLAFRVCVVAGVFSSLLSNTGVVAALIPVIASVSRDTDVPASRLYMPLAFGALLGGTTTLIGTSSNIAVQQTLLAQGVDAGAAATARASTSSGRGADSCRARAWTRRSATTTRCASSSPRCSSSRRAR
jgi:Na+/H+ antiporter NhaD/arsenite permease-like protein